MTNKPSEDDKEAEARFNETLGRMLNTPHQPHKGAIPVATCIHCNRAFAITEGYVGQDVAICDTCNDRD